MSESFYVGVDVGTGSVRAALCTATGQLRATATQALQIFEPQPGYYEQSSVDIWRACCTVVKNVTSGVDVSRVAGVGFDATCSMVVLGKDGQPLTVSPSGLSDWNVIMWMDHRAETQAAQINATKHELLRYVGGAISLEMQTPKLLWLKQNLYEDCWQKAGHFLDLPDYLTWRATGSFSRSLCSLVCKWTYMADANSLQGWSETFFTQIGLQDLTDDDFCKLGQEVLVSGQPCGDGLTGAASLELGLAPNTPVAAGIVDAHAGGLGCLGCSAVPPGLASAPPLTSRMALILGTSACHMAVSDEPTFVPGVWGPYFSAMIPELWLNEGGQSAVGKLIDHIVESHPSYSWVKEDADTRHLHVHTVLNEVLEFTRRKQNLSSIDELTRHMHIWPDFHGNRSPLADSSLRGMVSGLSFASGAEDLACHYLATLQALAYGTKQILGSLCDSGHHIEALYACGGLAKNALFIQTCADVTGLPIVLPDAKEPVLLGAAMLGAYASGVYTSVQDAMKHMAGDGKTVCPKLEEKPFHDKKYAVFLKMLADQREYKDMMK